MDGRTDGHIDGWVDRVEEARGIKKQTNFAAPQKKRRNDDDYSKYVPSRITTGNLEVYRHPCEILMPLAASGRLWRDRWQVTRADFRGQPEGLRVTAQPMGRELTVALAALAAGSTVLHGEATHSPRTASRDIAMRGVKAASSCTAWSP